jgi:hypothetical protein
MPEQEKHFRADTVLAAFVVALLASFLVALAALLVKTLSIGVFDRELYANLTINILILFFFGGFALFKGSSLAAWLIYRHDVSWGYKLQSKRIYPIFFSSLVISGIVFSAVYFFGTQELAALAYSL